MKKEIQKLVGPQEIKILGPTYLYNLILSVFFFGLFWSTWTLDDVAFELDWFLFYNITAFRFQLIPCVLLFLLMIRQFFKDLNLLKFRFKSNQHYLEVIEDSSYKRQRDGNEGVGKTLLQTHDSLLVAVNKDEKLRFRYFLLYPFKGNLKDDKDFQVLEKSFNFYQKNSDKINNFASSYNVEMEGKKQYDFDIAYLDQTKRPPESLVLALTEVANILPNSESRLSKDPKKDLNNMIKKNETFSLSRQWFDMHIFTDEQRTGEIFLGLRALSKNTTLKSRRRILEPKLLVFIRKKLYNIILKKGFNNTKFLSNCYNLVEKLIMYIGFYAFTEVNIDTGEEKEIVIPCKLFFKFDTRGERKKYKLYDKEPDYEETTENNVKEG